MSRKKISFWKKNDGATAVVLALTLPVLVGTIGLGLDTGTWYLAKRDLQNAVDAATVASAYDLSVANPEQSTIQSTAQSEMQRNGFDASSQVIVTAHYPPQSGTQIGNTQAVEIIATQPNTRFFSKLFLDTDPTIQARAAATRQPSGSACILALNPNASNALYFQGNTHINLKNCTGASNSGEQTSIHLSGSGDVHAFSLYSAGNIDQSGSSSLTVDEPSVTYGTPINDPYSGLNVPSYSGCNYNNYNTNSSGHIDPGVYCNGMRFRSHANIVMNPGIYIIDRGDFDANAGATITGTGVTIILTSSTGSNYANVNIAGGANMTLTAPTSGTFAGVLFFQDRDAPPALNKNKLLGGSSTTFTGALYFPSQEVQFSGNNSNNDGACTKIVADTITFIGDSYLTNDCPNSVATIHTQGIVQLVE